jgi:hypothetical protein
MFIVSANRLMVVTFALQSCNQCLVIPWAMDLELACHAVNVARLIPCLGVMAVVGTISLFSRELG